MATVLKAIAFIDNSAFRSKNADKKFALTELPTMPPAPQFDLERTTPSSTYVMAAAEEKQRFLEFNYAKRGNIRACRELDSLPAGSKRRRVLKLAKFYANRAGFLEEYLVRQNLPLVYSLFARNRPRYSAIDAADAVSDCSIVLLNCIGKFNVDRGFKFSTYACRGILNSLSRAHGISSKRKSRFPTTDLIDAQGEAAPTGADPLEDWKDRLRAALQSESTGFAGNEILVLTKRYGLDGSGEHTLEQVGDSFQPPVSKERVRQIQVKAEGKLRKVLLAA